MKKIFIIMLTLVYGFSSLGMTINLHYCCGELDSVSFATETGKTCKMGNHGKDNGCCNDQKIYSQYNNDQRASAEWAESVKQAIAGPIYQTVNVVFYPSLILGNRLATSTPGYLLSIPLFIKHCVFKI